MCTVRVYTGNLLKLQSHSSSSTRLKTAVLEYNLAKCAAFDVDHTDPHADPHAEPHAEPHADPHVDPHVDPHADPHADPHVDPHADPHADPHVDPHQHTPTHTDTPTRAPAHPYTRACVCMLQRESASLTFTMNTKIVGHRRTRRRGRLAGFASPLGIRRSRRGEFYERALIKS
ncbi:Circumsporozoite protein [Eumeta japonica]|uniref:Circumsporozoite protein n=1 Tax=Eumeta variegata TaxID=151549 RepID=A0A4C1UWM7_EUMVA|nr:Circumsporozoite protein [Eumeta japonica]